MLVVVLSINNVTFPHSADANNSAWGVSQISKLDMLSDSQYNRWNRRSVFAFMIPVFAALA